MSVEELQYIGLILIIGVSGFVLFVIRLFRPPFVYWDQFTLGSVVSNVSVKSSFNCLELLFSGTCEFNEHFFELGIKLPYIVMGGLWYISPVLDHFNQFRGENEFLVN